MFVTGRTKRAIENHFDRKLELEVSLDAKGKGDVQDMVRNIIPKGVNCVFVRQPETLGLGHAVLYAAPVIGNEPFAVLLADDFMRGDVLATAALPKAYGQTGQYVFDPEIFEILRGQKPGFGGEIQLADAIDTLADRRLVMAQCQQGLRYDYGSKFGYLEAIVDAALEHEEYATRFRALMMDRLVEKIAAE